MGEFQKAEKWNTEATIDLVLDIFALHSRRSYHEKASHTEVTILSQSLVAVRVWVSTGNFYTLILCARPQQKLVSSLLDLLKQMID